MAVEIDKYVCCECIGDPFLKKEIIEGGFIENCNYCEMEKPCISLDDLADRVDGVYRNNYKPGEEYPYIEDDEESTSWGTSGDYPEIIISEMLGIDENIANDLTNILSGLEIYDVVKGGDTAYYDNTNKYEETPIFDTEHAWQWHEFCTIVKHKSRFFSEKAIGLLNNLFQGLRDLKHTGEKEPIRLIDENSDDRFVYRARRTLNSKERIEIFWNPVKGLGPPPSTDAIPGRMNPAGISAFYGALDRKTCLSEIRLGVGEVAVSCKFEVIRPLQILDLTIFDKIYSELSLFDPIYEQKVSHLMFLMQFEAEISKPILPHEEILEYIPTQAFVEYLANYFNPKIDAVIYSSVQTNRIGKNIVILNHAAAIEKVEDSFQHLPENPQFEEMWNDRYIIWEKDTSKKLESEDFFSFPTDTNTSEEIEEQKNISLKFVPNSLKIHKVVAVHPDIDSKVVDIHLKRNNKKTDSEF